VLDDRIEGFAAQGRFTHGVLGLLSVTEQLQALAALPCETASLPREGALVDFFLGLISFGRSLRATIGCAPPRAPGAGPAAQAPDNQRAGNLMR
jgi:hypothetical protein